jgi:HlyD family secretion protein
VLEQDKLKPIAIETGITDSRNTEVVAGDLKAGDRVVIEDLRAPAPQTTGSVRMRMF